MAALSGQPSCSYAGQTEMVGQGARRNLPHQPCLDGENSRSHTSGLTSTGNISMATLDGNGTKKNGLRKHVRRHVYHDIKPLKLEEHKNSTLQSDCSKAEGSASVSRHAKSSEKPAIPPKPKYILRDKRTRHVYQTIDLPVTNGHAVVPPPLPPARQKHSLNEMPPPLPPRVVNEEAIRQRQKLDQEYFENLRKSVDEDLLGLAEEGDLPVPVHVNTPVFQGQRHSHYGAHSPPLNQPTDLRDAESEPSRRHSLPIYESISDNNTSDATFHRPPPTTMPVRANSHDLELEEKICPGRSAEVNLAQNLRLLEKCGWYWGNMTWQEAEELLANMEGEGVFLMRDSQNPLHLLTITVRSTTNSIHHVRVEYSEGKFQLYEPGRSVSRSTAQCVRHSNIKQFINLAIKHSTSGSFLYFLKPKNMGDPPVQIRLLTPISRLMKVKSLKYLSRLMIRKCVVAELIPSIPLPVKIQQYLMSGPYYDCNEEI